MHLPNPQRIELPAHEGVRGTALDPIGLTVYEAGPASGTTVVLCHGFPELAYSWRHQIAGLADAGFHVLAPDQRGYGASDCPSAIEDYSLLHLCGDLVRLFAESEIYKGVEKDLQY